VTLIKSPQDLHLSVDLRPYTLQRVDSCARFRQCEQQVTLQQDKDFISAADSDGGIPVQFWRGISVRQDIDHVDQRPSNFRKTNSPVDRSLNAAMAFSTR